MEEAKVCLSCGASIPADAEKSTLEGYIIRGYVQPITPASGKPSGGLVERRISFTTRPKTRRHKKHTVSLDRARRFMFHLWCKGLKECSYETLEYEFVQCFGTNEPRVLARYLGKPKRKVYYSGSSVVRINRLNGKIAHFEYQNERTIQHKKGLLEILGYISQEEKGRYRLHHEMFGYSYQQVSIDKMCVCPIEATESKQQHALREGMDRVEKKEEVIDHTHILRHNKYAIKHTCYASASEENAILNAKPCEEPDRAKVQWRVR